MPRKDKHPRTGSAKVRRERKWWLLEKFGDGETCMCANGCGTRLYFENLTVDRYPIPGIDGGTYRHDNIRPVCLPCNSSLGAKLVRERRGIEAYKPEPEEDIRMTQIRARLAQ